MLSQEAQFHSILNGDTCDNKTELICCLIFTAPIALS